MEKLEKTIQIASVHVGPFGGAVFRGTVINERTELRCVVNSRNVVRTPRAGEFWHVVGLLAEHVEYGYQLYVSSCTLVDLPSAAYVSSLLLKHQAFRGFALGKKKVRALLRHFGAEQLVTHLNNNNIQLLGEIISPEIATSLVAAWGNLKREVETINFLRENKFSPDLARKVIKLCRYNTIERLKSDPYTLVCFGDISKNIWKTTEVCARKLGIPANDSRRLVGGVLHILYKNLRKGHTACDVQKLVTAAEEVLGSIKRAEEGVAMALRQRMICVLPCASEALIQLTGIAWIEHSVETRIKQLIAGPSQMSLSLFEGNERRLRSFIDSYIDRHRQTEGYSLTSEQQNATFMALSNKCSVIDGFGGTGKTSCLKAIADIVKFQQRNVYLMALAGKAKERVRRATGHSSFTIHAFIKAATQKPSGIGLDGNPLLVIDEASMIDIALFNNLLRIFDYRPYSLLLVGDRAQISPVGFGLVFHRMVKSPQIPVVRLTTVHRQKAALYRIAMQIRTGDINCLEEIAEWRGETEGVYMVTVDKKYLKEQLLDLKRMEIRGYLPKAQILTPHMSERMLDSGARINRFLQSHLNGQSEGIRLGQTWLRVGDPVIVTENNYDIGLFNGTTGRLMDMTESFGQLHGIFEFDGYDETFRLSTDDLFDVRMHLAYAISFHKSQGSDYDTSIITCITDSEMNERSLIYTAVTRAKKLCLIVGSQEIFRAAVARTPRADTLCVGFLAEK